MSAMMSGRLAALAIPILTASATRINAAHRNALAAGRSMLAYAVEAGRLHLDTKEDVHRARIADAKKNPTFVDWCGENLQFSYRTAADYMRMVKVADVCNLSEGTIQAVIEANSTPRPAAPLPQFTHDDAERILKLAAMANGGNVNEEIVACEMLDRMAGRFGMTGEEAQAKDRHEQNNTRPGPTGFQILLYVRHGEAGPVLLLRPLNVRRALLPMPSLPPPRRGGPRASPADLGRHLGLPELPLGADWFWCKIAQRDM